MKKLISYKPLLMGIIVLALPAIGEMSLNTLLGMADTLMISHFIGPEALSGVGFANQIMFTLIFIFTSFNTGATAMIARSYGEKNYKRLNKVAGETTTINFVLGIIVTILGIIFMESIFSIYDLSDTVRAMTLEYFSIVILSGIFMFLSFSFAAILRGSGDTKTPMYITGLANITNIIGNYVLIKGVGPFPEMGVAGAALATTLSRGIAVSIYIYILFIKDRQVTIKKSDLGLTKEILRPLWRFSYPGAIEQALMQLSFVVAGIFISSLDTYSESAFRLLITIESTSFMPAVGMSIASATLVGKALGEKNTQRAVETGYGATFLGLTWGIFSGIVFLLFPNPILKVFTPDMVVIEAALLAMIWAGFNQPFLNSFIVMSGALRGAGDTRGVMFITFIRLWVLFVPLTYLFISRIGYGVEGLWMAEITSLALSGIVLFRRFAGKSWLDLQM